MGKKTFNIKNQVVQAEDVKDIVGNCEWCFKEVKEGESPKARGAFEEEFVWCCKEHQDLCT